MNFIQLENFIAFITFAIFLNILNVKINGYSVPRNISDEIKSIFRHNYVSTQSKTAKDFSTNKNFAEGGLIKENNANNATSTTEKHSLDFDDKSHFSNETKSGSKFNALLIQNKSSSLLPEVNKQNSDIPTVKPTILKKLNDSEPNLFLGVPEVIHINGTSSIKPRKGVHYTKIVPRKGVDTEIEGNETDLRPDFCLWTNESKCDVVFNKESKECLCCKNNVTHNLQHLLNCSNCNSENILLEKDNCYKICCENEINDNYNVKLNEIEDKKTSNSINSMKTAKKISLQPHEKKEKNLEDKHLNLFITKEKINLNLTKKLKPDITKVPYDIEVVSGLINSKKEVLVPVAASIFLLPLIGIFIFFIWRRTKEYWDKRYYKRMDFLIDGMYND